MRVGRLFFVFKELRNGNPYSYACKSIFDESHQIWYTHGHPSFHKVRRVTQALLQGGLTAYRCCGSTPALLSQNLPKYNKNNCNGQRLSSGLFLALFLGGSPPYIKTRRRETACLPIGTARLWERSRSWTRVWSRTSMWSVWDEGEMSSAACGHLRLQAFVKYRQNRIGKFINSVWNSF